MAEAAGSKVTSIARPSKSPSSKTQVTSEAAQELVFAVVGHIGCGTSAVASSLQSILKSDYSAETCIIKASVVIEAWAKNLGIKAPEKNDKRTIASAEAWQDLGDKFRLDTADNSAVAKALIQEIRKARGLALRVDVVDGEPVVPDGAPRAYIIDALRHPAEVNLLRHLYQDAFVLIGVVCDQKIRENRLQKKLDGPSPSKLLEFMKRDEKDLQPHGQQVAKTFQLADFYVDNTPDRFIYSEIGVSQKENPDWDINDKLKRLVRIVTGKNIERPEISETAMHHAYSAQLRSACLSRQVGAALVDKKGNLLATGTNEVPKAGGGVYGEAFRHDGAETLNSVDQRCAYRPEKFCSSTREQNTIIDSIVDELSSAISEGSGSGSPVSDEIKAALRKKLKEGRVGDTIEFSRAVHAEMDALLSASRAGATTVGTRLFVTTYPCHYCARHIISAGVDEVQYIEPYFKSLATKLHSDAIQQSLKDWKPPSKMGSTVLFRPFTGVAPRLYHRAFIKDRDLKNDDTGELKISSPDWGTPWHLRRKSYVQLEAQITKA